MVGQVEWAILCCFLGLGEGSITVGRTAGREQGDVGERAERGVVVGTWLLLAGWLE